MKSCARILIALLVCLLLTLPLSVSARTYAPSDTDMRIEIDDSRWYVFTKDNLENNPELEELGLSVDDLNAIFRENNAYLDAVLYYENGDFVELIGRKSDIDLGVANLSNYDDDEVLELAEGLAEEKGAEEYSVYKSQYKFTKMEYTEADYHIYEFVTIVNKETYSFTFQATAPFAAEEYAEMDDIVDSITFDVDASLKEEESSSVLESAITGAIVGGGASAIAVFIKKKTKKGAEKAKEMAQDPNGWTCSHCNTQNLSSNDTCWSCGQKRDG